MKIYTLILQKPLQIKTYSSKEALIKDNDLKTLETSRSTLEKYDFKRFYFVNSKAIITLTEVQSSGDIDRKKNPLTSMMNGINFNIPYVPQRSKVLLRFFATFLPRNARK